MRFGVCDIFFKIPFLESVGNDSLVELIEKEGIEYARENFQLSILEVWPMKTDDETIINRESFWKEVLLTRGQFGYNNN